MVKKRASVERPYCSWTMTRAERTSFIKAALRSKSRFWKPAQDALKESKRGYNQYECNMCHIVWPSKLPPLVPYKKNKDGKMVKCKRITNNVIDHINEVVDEKEGWVSWDSFIERLFCEKDWFQILCASCNHKKTTENNTIRRNNK